MTHTLPRPARLLLVLGCLLAACGQQPAPAATEPPTALPPTAEVIPATAPAAEASPAPTTDAGPQTTGDWTVEIVQNGQASPTDTGQVRLARAPFSLRVSLPAPLPVKLNANADDANFIGLQPGYVFTEDCFDALCTGMDVAEERLNPTQTLFVDPQSTHYLYYQGPDDHRWSRATVGETGAVFERDVALLNDVPVEEFAPSELYLLFFVDLSNPGIIDPGELKKITLLFQ